MEGFDYTVPHCCHFQFNQLDSMPNLIDFVQALTDSTEEIDFVLFSTSDLKFCVEIAGETDAKNYINWDEYFRTHEDGEKYFIITACVSSDSFDKINEYLAAHSHVIGCEDPGKRKPQGM